MRPSIALLFLAACTPSGSPPPAPDTSAHQAVASATVAPAPAAPTGACPPATQKRVTELADAYRAKSAVPGVAIAVHDAGQRCIVTSGTLREGGEKVAKDTIFSMGSVQKVFNATLLAYAIENGKAKIDDPATKYLTAANGATVPASAAFARRGTTRRAARTRARSPACGRPEDMLAFLEANLGVRTLPDLQRRAFARTHVALFDKKGAAAIGMGWEITGKGDDVTLAKNGAGAGFSSWIGFDPKSKRGVVVLTNAQNLGDGKPPVLGHEVLSSLR